MIGDVMARMSIAVVLVLVGLDAAATANAADRRGDWETKLAESSRLLAEQEFDASRDQLRKLVSEMADAIGEPGSADRLFGIALAQLAVAEAGAGDTDKAVWLWHVAQNVYPSIGTVDLSVYGETGAPLIANTLPVPPVKCTRPPTDQWPAVLKRVEPKYPREAKRRPVTGLVIVEMQVDADGRPMRPQVLRSPLSALTYSTLLALREWRFEVASTASEGDTPFCRIFSFGPPPR